MVQTQTTQNPTRNLYVALLFLLAAIVGAWAATRITPILLPSMGKSLIEDSPKAYWYLSRASAFVAFILLWITMLLGLLMTSRTAQLWPGGPVAFEVHQHVSLLGMAFVGFHALILLGDHYMQYTLVGLLMPFASGTYRPLWVGIGQVNLYLLLIVGLSFYVRPLIGHRLWRLLHYLSLCVFLLAIIHGLQSGTDSPNALAQGLYWVSGGSVLFLTFYRVLHRRR